MREYRRALRDYDAVLALCPSFAETLNNRGAVYEALGDDASAKENYLRAIEAAPKFAAAYYNLACLYSRSDSLEYASIICGGRWSWSRIWRQKRRMTRIWGGCWSWMI